MNGIGAVITLTLCLGVLTLRRTLAAFCIVSAALFLTEGQGLSLGGLNLTSIRLVLGVAFGRIVLRKEWDSIRLNKVDSAFVAYVVVGLLAHTLRTWSWGPFVYQLGFAYNALLGYFVMRSLINSIDDVESLMGVLQWALIILSLTFVSEAIFGRNVFSTFGGVPEMSELRKGHFRCQGAFRSPITAGTCGAILMPLYFVRSWLHNFNVKWSFGLIAATTMTITSRSSGPAIAYLSGIFGLYMWRFRGRLKIFLIGGLLCLCLLHMAMKAPVWYLLARVSDLIGGGGWHRAELIDQAIRHFGSWWLLGTNDTEDWMPTQLTAGGADITNEFISAGVRGGALTMCLLILTIWRAFSWIGSARKMVAGCSGDKEKILWAAGVCLFGNVVNFFSVSYFDQIWVFWYMELALASSISCRICQSNVLRNFSEPR